MMFNPLSTGHSFLSVMLCSAVLLSFSTHPVYSDEPFSLTRTPAVRSSKDVTPQTPQQTAFILSNAANPVPPKSPVLDGDDVYDVPDPEIMGADQPIEMGELVDLWIKPWDKKPEDLHSVKYSWTVLPTKEVVLWPDGSRIIFGTGTIQTTYVVVLNASYVFTEKDIDGNIAEIVQRVVTKIQAVQIIGGTTTGPVNPPVDPPPVDPGLTGLAKSAFDWVAMVNTSPTYSATIAKNDAAKLAVSFRAVADKIKDGTYNNVTVILQQTKISNDAAITARNNWLPWFTQMSQYLQTAYADNSIKTNAQFEQAWRDIATGLDAASK